MAIPVEPLQVEHRLGHPLVPRLNQSITMRPPLQDKLSTRPSSYPPTLRQSLTNVTAARPPHSSCASRCSAPSTAGSPRGGSHSRSHHCRSATSTPPPVRSPSDLCRRSA